MYLIFYFSLFSFFILQKLGVMSFFPFFLKGVLVITSHLHFINLKALNMCVHVSVYVQIDNGTDNWSYE